VFIDDVVDAILAALNKGMGKGVIQIGPRESHSISDIAERIVRLSGKEIIIEYDLSRPEGDKDRAADITKAETILDWRPQTLLDEGLEKTYLWASNNLY
jgi:nucleoside-diphosphate-sugar epimerase